MFQIYSKKVAENIFSTVRKFFTKDRIAPKIKQLRFKYRKALDLVIQSGAGRPNPFYDICSEIWRRSRWAIELLKSGVENTSGGIKAGENNQPEERTFKYTLMRVKASKMRNNAKHWVSIDSNERQSQNKNRALHLTGSRTSRGWMEEMLNNRRDKKQIKSCQRFKRAHRQMEPTLKKF